MCFKMVANIPMYHPINPHDPPYVRSPCIAYALPRYSWTSATDRSLQQEIRTGFMAIEPWENLGIP